MSEDGSSSGEEDGSDSKKPPAKVVFAPTRSRLLKDEKYRSATVFTRFRSNVSSPSKSSDVPYFGTEEEEYVEAEEEVTDDELYMWTESDLPDVFLLGTDDEDETAMLATEDPTDVLTDIREMEDDALIRPDLAFGDQQTLADEQEISDFTLLEPDHPQMRRFQEALKECHEAKNNELLLRIKEIGNLLKKQRAEKEEIAVHLNYLQIDLDRAKGFLVKQEEEFQMVKMRRLQEEEDLKKFRVKYDEKLFGMDCLRKKIENVQTELDNVNLKNLIVERENNRVKGNIIISKRCVSKSKQVISEVEELQQECDIWITRLDNKVEKLEEDIALLENNLEAQLLERKAINDDLREAEIELEAVQMEKKNLMQQWYCRLEDSQKSEETYNSITENYRHMKSDWKIQCGELEKMKRLLSAEHEKSEHHQVDLKKMSFRVKGVHKILASKQPEYVELKEKIAKFEKILKATNAALELTTTQRLKVQSKISRLSKIYDRHVVERNKLQKEIEEKNREMVILDTVSQKLHKQLSSLNQQMILMEKQVVTKENVVAKSFVRISKHIIVNSAVEKLLSKLIEKVHSKDKAMASSKEEAHRLDSLINHKNAQMAVLQNKIERLLALTGGRQVNPYELQLSYLNDQIERENMQINELRKVWLADQAELIHMMKERDAEEDKINKMKQEAVLMEAKKMRIEGEIESQERESLMIDRRRRKTEIEVFRMNILIFKEKGTRESSVNEQKFSINFFNAIIKDEQKHFVEMQDELNVLMKKKNQMVEELVEIEKQILLWEKKVHIAKEMKATFGNLSWADEISSMKNEVWKMELRQGVLRKETERLNQVLEQLAVKTVDLLSVDESSLKAKQKANLNRQINDLQDKVKEKRQELKRLDKELHRHTDDGHRLQDEIFQREVELLRMQNLMESMEDDIRLMRIAKIRNLKDIVLTQSILKDFELAVVKTQNPYWTPSVMGFDRMKECEKFLKIIKEVEVHHPEASDDLKEIANCYKSKHLDFLKKYI